MGLPAGAATGQKMANKPFNGLDGVFAHYGIFYEWNPKVSCH
jgi:hypothetical protein